MIRIKLKSSDIQNNVPMPSDIIPGELAINTADGKVFLKTDSGVVKEVGIETVIVDDLNSHENTYALSANQGRILNERISSGLGDVNVQSNWLEGDVNSDAFIKNKPDDVTNLSKHSATELKDINSVGSGKIITDAERIKLNQSEKNVQSDWNITDTNLDAYIKNKPTDLTELNKHSAAELKDITSVGSGKIITDAERSKLNNITSTGSGKIITDAERSKLTGIQDGANKNVQADWNQSNTNSDAYIKNKPEVVTSKAQGPEIRISEIVRITKADYDALLTYQVDKLYMIVG